MKFYNLTFNCNTPTKQQINVPTNTNYKVGVKVIRNGKQSILTPYEVKLDALSADAEKTNGYVTFTAAAGDFPSCVEKSLEIEHGYDAQFQEWGVAHNTTGADLSATLLSVDVSEYAGCEVYAKDLSVSFGGGNSEPTEESLLSAIIPYWEVPNQVGYGQYANHVLVKKANGDVIYGMRRDLIWQSWINAYGWDINKPAFVYQNAGSQTIYFKESFTIEDGDFIQMQNLVKNNRYAGILVKFNSGEPYTTKFKLVENVYKSQVGDLGAAGGSSNTVGLTGEYADGTQFNFNVLTK